MKVTELSQEQKESILQKHNCEKMVGYCFSACPADDDMLTFVDKEDAEAVFKKGPQTYWWNPSHECLYELDTAFEYFFDDFYCDHQEEYADEEKALDFLLNELESPLPLLDKFPCFKCGLSKEHAIDCPNKSPSSDEKKPKERWERVTDGDGNIIEFPAEESPSPEVKKHE